MPHFTRVRHTGHRAWAAVARAALLPGALLPGVSLRVSELLGGRPEHRALFEALVTDATR